jgi:hypothetical protein
VPAWATFLVVFYCGALSSADNIRQLRPDRSYDFQAEGYESPTVVTAVAVSPDGAQIAASGDDHQVRLWDVASGARPRMLKSHDDWVRCLRFDDDGLRLASVGDDHRLKVWNAIDAQVMVENHSSLGPLGSVEFLPGGQQLVTAAYGDKVRLYNLSSGVVDKQFDCPCRDDRVMAVSPNGKWLAVAGRNGGLRVWDLTSGAAGRDIPADSQRINAIAFSPDSKLVATGGNGPMMRLWDLASGDLSAELPARPAKVRALLFLDDNRLASGGTDNHIHLWNIAKQQQTHRLVGHTGTVATIARDASGRVLVSGGFDTTVMLWRVPLEATEETAKAGAASVR